MPTKVEEGETLMISHFYRVYDVYGMEYFVGQF